MKADDPARSLRADLIAAIARRLPARRWQATHWMGKLARVPDRPFVARTADGLAEVRPAEAASASAFYTGLYEREVTRWLEDRVLRLRPGAVIDVGANFGYYPLRIGRLSGGRTRVLAVEPDPENFAWLCRNLGFNPGINCTPVNAAGSDSSGGTIPFRLSQPGRSLWAGCDVAGAPAADGSVVQVPTLTVDELATAHGLDRVDTVLIDVEGFEDRVLAGMAGGFAARRYGAVMVEVHPRAFGSPSAIEAMFEGPRAAGYRLFRFERDLRPDADKHFGYYSARFDPRWLGPPRFLGLNDWENFLLTSPDSPPTDGLPNHGHA